MEEKSIQEMTYELAEYAENSGFKDYYNRKLCGKSDEEIVKLYNEVFGEKKSTAYVAL